MLKKILDTTQNSGKIWEDFEKISNKFQQNFNTVFRNFRKNSF